MKISIRDDDYEGDVYWCHGGPFEVPDEVVARWDAARDAWEQARSEMNALLDARKEQLRKARSERTRLQHERDRIEVERLRREALKGAQCSAT